MSASTVTHHGTCGFWRTCLLCKSRLDYPSKPISGALQHWQKENHALRRLRDRCGAANRRPSPDPSGLSSNRQPSHMPLIKYGLPERNLSTSTRMHPLRASFSDARPPTVTSKSDHGLPRCMNCGSTDVRTLPTAFEMGTNTLRSATVGVGLTAGNLGAAFATTSGRQASLLAERLAPPLEAPFDWAKAALSGCAVGILAFLVIASTLNETNSRSQSGFGPFLLPVGRRLRCWWNPSKNWISESRCLQRFYLEPTVQSWQRSVVCGGMTQVTDPG